jgi:hypothetical protein
MPFECLLTRWTAMNQSVNGSFERGMTVPAVTEVCRPQEPHSQVNLLPESFHAFTPLQGGQTKPPGQRFSNRYLAQAASFGNRCAKAARDIGRSCFQRPGMRT